MSKTIIAPIVAVIALLVQFVFGVEIPEEVVNELTLTITNTALVAITLMGIIKSHDKKKDKDTKK